MPVPCHLVNTVLQFQHDGRLTSQNLWNSTCQPMIDAADGTDVTHAVCIAHVRVMSCSVTPADGGADAANDCAQEAIAPATAGRLREHAKHLAESFLPGFPQASGANAQIIQLTQMQQQQHLQLQQQAQASKSLGQARPATFDGASAMNCDLNVNNLPDV